MTQGTPASRPLYNIAAINGQPELQFDGTNDCLFRSATDLFAGGAYTLAIVKKLDVVANNRVIYGNQKGDGSGGCYFGTGVGVRLVAHGGAFGATGGAATTAWDVTIQTRPAGAVPTLKVNNANDPLSGAGTGMQPATATASINIGANTPLTSFQAMRCTWAVAFASAVPDAAAYRMARAAGAIYGIAT